MTRKRGFGAISPERQREIASLGGKAAHASGNAHTFDAAAASKAGRLGGLASAADVEHMREIGRRGGLAAARKRKKEEAST